MRERSVILVENTHEEIHWKGCERKEEHAASGQMCIRWTCMKTGVLNGEGPWDDDYTMAFVMKE
jgi:hypothetical protein